jgi:hypothetical protein
MFSEESPTRKTGHYQYARGDREERPSAPPLVGRLELRKIAIARTAGSQVIEPLLRFGEWHFMRSDSPENIRARAPGAFRVRKLLE